MAKHHFKMSGNDMRIRRPIHTYLQHGAARTAEIAARDIAEWFLPICAEGLLPGAKNRGQSVLWANGLDGFGNWGQINSQQWPERGSQTESPFKAAILGKEKLGE
jgi:hypothetical protein